MHGVSVRLARKARTAVVRRQAVGNSPADQEPLDPHPDPLDLLSARELLTLIDEEIGRLPEAYRLPVVLCDLEGRTQEDAARVLGWTHGSIRGRLLRGRARLKARLARRGLAPAALSAVLTSGLTWSMAEAAVPATLAVRVSRAAVLFSKGRATEGVSIAAVALAREGLRGMMLGKLKFAAVALLIAGMFATGAGILARQALAPQLAEEPKATPRVADGVPSRNTGMSEGRRDQDGDPLPARALSRLGTIRFRHGGLIDSLAFTPNGKTLVTCGPYNGIRVWDVATGKEELRPAEQKDGRAIALAPDGKRLAVLLSRIDLKPEAIAIRDLATGRVVRRFGKQGRHASLLFAPDGKTLAAFKWANDIEVWDTSTGRLLHTLTGHKDIVWSVAFSSDGKTLVSGGDDKNIRFWDVASGKELRRVAHNKEVGTVALSPDGKLLASIDLTKQVFEGGGTWFPDGRIHLWDVATGTELRKLVLPLKEIAPKIPAGFNSVAFAPDGKTLVTTAMDATLRIWDPQTGRQLRQFAGFAGAAGHFAFAPDGKSLAVADGHTVIRLIDLAGGTDRLPLNGHRGNVSSAVVTPDCQTVVTSSVDGTLRFWDPLIGRERDRRPAPVHFLSAPRLLADGQNYLTLGSDWMYRLHDLATGKELAVLRGHTAHSPFALSPDRKTLAAVDADKTVRLIDPATGKVRHTLMKVKEYVSGMSFTPDSRTLVVWNADRVVTVWDSGTGQQVRRFDGPTNPEGEPTPPGGGGSLPYTAALSPDGGLLAFGLQNTWLEKDGILPVVDTLAGKEVRRFRVPKNGPQCIAFAPDGRSLAWSGWRDPTIHVGEIATGRVRRSFTGHSGDIQALAFSPDGTFLVSGSRDTTALVWDLSGRLDPADQRNKPLTEADLKTQWQALGEEDAASGFRAMQTLAFDPSHTVPYLRQQLHPVAAVDEKRLFRLIAELDSDQFADREKAAAELEKMGETALHALRQALEGQPALEKRRRLEQLIDKQQREKWSPSPERLRTLRSVEVLERIGNADARSMLKTLAGGAPGAWLTEDAKSSLDRVSRRTSG